MLGDVKFVFGRKQTKLPSGDRKKIGRFKKNTSSNRERKRNKCQASKHTISKITVSLVPSLFVGWYSSGTGIGDPLVETDVAGQNANANANAILDYQSTNPCTMAIGNPRNPNSITQHPKKK